MTHQADFVVYVTAVRAQDEAAIEQLYQDVVLEVVAFIDKHLRSYHLGTVYEGLGVFHRALLPTLEHLSAGHYALANRGQIAAFLKTLGVRRLTELARHCHREMARREPGSADKVLRAQVARDADPGKEAEDKEALAWIQAHVTTLEYSLLIMRMEEQDWTDIGAALGMTAEAARKKNARLIVRLAKKAGTL